MVSNIFYFHPYLGKIPILTHIFQRGWFNHQLDLVFIFAKSEVNIIQLSLRDLTMAVFENIMYTIFTAVACCFQYHVFSWPRNMLSKKKHSPHRSKNTHFTGGVASRSSVGPLTPWRLRVSALFTWPRIRGDINEGVEEMKSFF